MSREISFNFPPTKFSKINKPSQQLDHLWEECNEANAERIYGNEEAFIEEAVDACHSAETLLRCLINQYGEEKIKEVMDNIVKKNSLHERDYYNLGE